MRMEVKTEIFKKGLINADTNEVILECMYDSIEVVNGGKFIIAGRYENSLLTVKIYDSNLRELKSLSNVFSIEHIIGDYFLIGLKNEKVSTELVDIRGYKRLLLFESASIAVVNKNKFVLHCKLFEKEESFLAFFEIDSRKAYLVDIIISSTVYCLKGNDYICCYKEKREDLGESKYYKLLFNEEDKITVSNEKINDFVYFGKGIDSMVIKKGDFCYIADSNREILHYVDNVKRIVQLETMPGIIKKRCVIECFNGDTFLYTSLTNELKKLDRLEDVRMYF